MCCHVVVVVALLTKTMRRDGCDAMRAMRASNEVVLYTSKLRTHGRHCTVE